MPSIFVHRTMAAKVQDKLPFQLEENIFMNGAAGPDNWFFYKLCNVPLWMKYRSRAVEMHNKKTGDFLEALEEASVGNGMMFSYLCGFICHFCLDRAAHPYIDYRAPEHPLGHFSLEKELDCIELERQGITGKHPISTRLWEGPFPESMKEGITKAYEVYGLSDVWEDANGAIRDSVRYYRLIEHPNPLVYIPASLSGMVKAIVYNHHEGWVDPENNSHSPWFHPKDKSIMSRESFSEIVDRAVDEAVSMIEKAYLYAFHGGEKYHFPNLSYKTGFLIEAEDPAEEEETI